MAGRLERLSDQTLARFLDEVARASPAPGGGSSAGVACALAAGLVEMVAGIELGRVGAPATGLSAGEGAGAAGGEGAPRAGAPATGPPAGEGAEAAGDEGARPGALREGGPARLRALREGALALAERERVAYGPVLEAQRLPRDHPQRGERIERALLEASRTPLEIAEAAAEVAELGGALAAVSAPSLRGDALAGVVLAEAAAAAATTLVEINLAGVPSGDALERVRAARARATAARGRLGG